MAAVTLQAQEVQPVVEITPQEPETIAAQESTSRPELTEYDEVPAVPTPPAEVKAMQVETPAENMEATDYVVTPTVAHEKTGKNKKAKK